MGPRHNAAENDARQRAFQKPVRLQWGRGTTPRKTAPDIMVLYPVPDASMGPRHNAAENLSWPQFSLTRKSFNGAAAQRRGKQRRSKSLRLQRLGAATARGSQRSTDFSSADSVDRRGTAKKSFIVKELRTASAPGPWLSTGPLAAGRRTLNDHRPPLDRIIRLSEAHDAGFDLIGDTDIDEDHVVGLVMDNRVD